MSIENKKDIEEAIRLSRLSEENDVIRCTYTPNFTLDALLELGDDIDYSLMMLAIMNKLTLRKREKQNHHKEEDVIKLLDKNMIEFVDGYIEAILDPDDWK